MADDQPTSKIELRGNDGNVETLWAFSLGSDRYRLDNSPFFAYGVSWQDIVEATPESEGGFPVLVRVLEKSGNRTVRVILDPPADESNESAAVLSHLVEELGCSYEGANPGYLAVNIPPEVELSPVCDYLTSAGIKWEHADPTYADLHENQ